MKCTATQLRKNLFAALEKAADGEPIEITYKGQKFVLEADLRGSKLARLEPHPDFFLVDPDSIIYTDPKLMAEMQAAWEEDWKDI